MVRLIGKALNSKMRSLPRLELDAGLANPRDLPVRGPQARVQVWLLQTCASRVPRACSRGFCAGLHLTPRVPQAGVWRVQPAGFRLVAKPGQASGSVRKEPKRYLSGFLSSSLLPPLHHHSRVCIRACNATRSCTLWATLQLNLAL